MEIDRRSFLATLGGTAALDMMSSEARADEIEHYGRHFKQPKEGLGFDNSPVAHMWRTLIYPDHPL